MFRRSTETALTKFALWLDCARTGASPIASYCLRKAQLSFYPEPEDYARLRALSARTGVPQQVYLRRGLDFVLQTYDAVATKRRVTEVRQHTRNVMANFSRLASEFESLAVRSGSGRRSGGR